MRKEGFLFKRMPYPAEKIIVYAVVFNIALSVFMIQEFDKLYSLFSIFIQIKWQELFLPTSWYAFGVN